MSYLDTKNRRKIEQRIDKAVDKIIQEYGCVLVALQWDDDELIKTCEASGHTLYHRLRGRVEVDTGPWLPIKPKRR